MSPLPRDVLRQENNTGIACVTRCVRVGWCHVRDSRRWRQDCPVPAIPGAGARASPKPWQSDDSSRSHCVCRSTRNGVGTHESSLTLTFDLSEIVHLSGTPARDKARAFPAITYSILALCSPASKALRFASPAHPRGLRALTRVCAQRNDCSLRDGRRAVRTRHFSRPL